MAMSPSSTFTPGSYCLVALSSSEPLWPAVVCTDDMVPEKILKIRPYGYMFPVLVMHKFEFLWVARGDVEGFEPLCEDARAGMKSNLLSAYMAVQDPENPFPSLDYWRDSLFARLVDQEGDNTNDASSPEKSDSSKQSAANVSRKRKLLTLGSTESPTPVKRRRLGTPFPLSDKKSVTNEDTLAPLSPKSQEGDLKDLGLFEDTSDDESDDPAPSGSPITEPTQDDETPNSDLPKDIVTFFIGKSQQPFKIPRIQVENRGCFRDVMAWEEKNGYCMRRPAYNKLNSTYFSSVVEFLTRGDFKPLLMKRGTKEAHVEDATTPSGKQIAILKCAEAWEVAREILIDDLMELVVEKLKILKPWPLLEILLVAKIVFAEASTDCEADNEMRKIISGYFAENFWSFAQKEFTNFKDKLCQCPELAKMVWAAMLAKAENIIDGGE